MSSAFIELSLATFKNKKALINIHEISYIEETDEETIIYMKGKYDEIVVEETIPEILKKFSEVKNV